MTESAIIQHGRIIFSQRSARPGEQIARRPLPRPYYWPMRARANVVALLLLILVAAPVSCGPPAISGGFDSPQPAARIFATRRAAAETDPDRIRAAMPGLIRNLESDDPAVRLLSAQALDELTGESYGYRYFDPEWLRAPAVHRWRDAWEQGLVTLRDGTRLGPDTLEMNAASERATVGR